MATAGQPRSSALDHVTRQQLDELDALMQRMLALPVNPPEDAPGAPTGQPQAATIPTSTNDPPVSRPDVPTEPAPASVRREPPEVANPLDAASHQAVNTPRSPRGALPQPPVTRSPGHPVTPSPSRPPRLAWPLRPFLWVNVVFDHTTVWLGPVGHWLRAPGGRALLGWTGLLLLAAALAWLVLDGMGWTW